MAMATLAQWGAMTASVHPKKATGQGEQCCARITRSGLALACEFLTLWLHIGVRVCVEVVARSFSSSLLLPQSCTGPQGKEEQSVRGRKLWGGCEASGEFVRDMRTWGWDANWGTV